MDAAKSATGFAALDLAELTTGTEFKGKRSWLPSHSSGDSAPKFIWPLWPMEERALGSTVGRRPNTAVGPRRDPRAEVVELGKRLPVSPFCSSPINWIPSERGAPEDLSRLADWALCPWHLCPSALERPWDWDLVFPPLPFGLTCFPTSSAFRRSRRSLSPLPQKHRPIEDPEVARTAVLSHLAGCASGSCCRVEMVPRLFLGKAAKSLCRSTADPLGQASDKVGLCTRPCCRTASCRELLQFPKSSELRLDSSGFGSCIGPSLEPSLVGNPSRGQQPADGSLLPSASRWWSKWSWELRSRPSWGLAKLLHSFCLKK